MPIYIDLNELEKGMYENPSDEYERGWNNALEGAMLAIEPNPDVTEVVRCKDCRWYEKNPWGNGEMVCQCWADWIHTDLNDYCSYGERKEQI